MYGIGISGVGLEESDIRHTIIKFGLHSLKLNALLHTFCAYITTAHVHVCVNVHVVHELVLHVVFFDRVFIFHGDSADFWNKLFSLNFAVCVVLFCATNPSV